MVNLRRHFLLSRAEGEKDRSNSDPLSNRGAEGKTVTIFSIAFIYIRATGFGPVSVDRSINP